MRSRALFAEVDDEVSGSSDDTHTGGDARAHAGAPRVRSTHVRLVRMPPDQLAASRVASLRTLSSLDDQLVVALQRGDIRLLRATWVRTRPAGFRMVRRQALGEPFGLGHIHQRIILAGDQQDALAVELFWQAEIAQRADAVGDIGGALEMRHGMGLFGGAAIWGAGLVATTALLLRRRTRWWLRQRYLRLLQVESDIVSAASIRLVGGVDDGQGHNSILSALHVLRLAGSAYGLRNDALLPVPPMGSK